LPEPIKQYRNAKYTANWFSTIQLFYYRYAAKALLKTDVHINATTEVLARSQPTGMTTA
jgi:hypothetical protein